MMCMVAILTLLLLKLICVAGWKRIRCIFRYLDLQRHVPERVRERRCLPICLHVRNICLRLMLPKSSTNLFLCYNRKPAIHVGEVVVRGVMVLASILALPCWFISVLNFHEGSWSQVLTVQKWLLGVGSSLSSGRTLCTLYQRCIRPSVCARALFRLRASHLRKLFSTYSG